MRYLTTSHSISEQVTLQDAVIANVSYTLTGGFDTVLNDTAVRYYPVGR